MGVDETLSCNLCWKPVQEPFIVTACNHVFCMEHKDLPKIKESTCPGCNKHLSPKNGLKIAHYGVDPTALNGLRPEQAVKAALTSVKFWVAQEQTKTQYERHLAKKMRTKLEDTTQKYQEALDERAQETERMQRQCEEAVSAHEDLRSEMQLLQEKYHEGQHSIRRLQDNIVDLKRKRGGGGGSVVGGASPQRDGNTSPARSVGGRSDGGRSDGGHKHTSPFHRGAYHSAQLQSPLRHPQHGSSRGPSPFASVERQHSRHFGAGPTGPSLPSTPLRSAHAGLDRAPMLTTQRPRTPSHSFFSGSALNSIGHRR